MVDTTEAESQIDVDNLTSLGAKIDQEYSYRKANYNHNLVEDPNNGGEGLRMLDMSSMPDFLIQLYEDPYTRQLAINLQEYCIDDGLSKAFKLNINNNVEVVALSTRGVRCLNRNGLIGKLLEGNESYDEARNRNITIYKIDFLKFRDIDNVEVLGDDGSVLPKGRHSGDPLRDPRGTETQADYVVIDAVSKALPLVEAINAALRSLGINGEVVFGRIGGDEFGIGFKGISDNQLIEFLYQKIINKADGIQSVDAYYLDEITQVVKKGKVEVKNLGIEILKFDGAEEEVEKVVFDRLKETGNFYSRQEALASLEGNSGVELPERLKNVFEGLKTKFSKSNRNLIEAIINQSPELARYFAALQSNPDLKVELAYFCVDYIYDRLTKAPITNFRIMLKRATAGIANFKTNNLQEGEVRYKNPQFRVYDLQGAKGINEVISYAATDIAVQSLSLEIFYAVDTLKSQLPTDQQEDVEVIIGRNGTKIVVFIAERLTKKLGVKRDLKSRFVSSLSRITGAEVNQKDVKCSVPVAQYAIDRSPATVSDGRKLFRYLINEANRVWRTKFIIKYLSPLTVSGKIDELIKLKRNMFGGVFVRPQKGILLQDYLKPEIFMPDTFRGIRPIERLGSLMSTASEMRNLFTATNTKNRIEEFISECEKLIVTLQNSN